MGVPSKRLLGWMPWERHDHYDAEGEFTGHTVITREPEWDDHSRDELLALAQYERGVHRCGYHESLIHDPDMYFMPTDETCPVCKVADQWTRVQHDADQKAEKSLQNKPREPRPSDGRSTYMRVLSPEETEAVKQRKAVNRGNTPGTRSPRA